MLKNEKINKKKIYYKIQVMIKMKLQIKRNTII